MVKTKVLVVEDEKDISELLQYNLEKEGFQVIQAYDGPAAIKKADQESPDLILLDLMLPDMDGLEATKKIRELTQFKNLPIISLTAKAMKGDREKALTAGASDYITKPVDPEKLLSLMYVWLRKGFVADSSHPGRVEH